MMINDLPYFNYEVGSDQKKVLETEEDFKNFLL